MNIILENSTWGTEVSKLNSNFDLVKSDEMASLNGLLRNQPTITGTNNYIGERVNLKKYTPSTYFYDSVKKTFPANIAPYNGHAGQGFLAHGNFGFFFYDGGYVQVLDMVGLTILNAFQLPAPSFYVNNHCGQANWGNEIPDGSDFPALYLSSYIEKICYVYNVTLTGFTLIQTIKLYSKGVQQNAQAFFIDQLLDKVIIKIGQLKDDNTTMYKYYKTFDLPKLSEGVLNGTYLELTIEDNAKNDEFFIRTIKGNSSYGALVNAGFAYQGKLYVLAGFSGETSRLFVYDYIKHTILSEIHWTPSFMNTLEQEQCCLWGNGILINYSSGNYLSYVEFK
jgi:hypothetical protein